MMYILVVIGYIYKWVKVNAFSNNEGKSAITFLKKNIFLRFGTTWDIINDGGLTFTIIYQILTWHKVEMPYHPYISGQVEVLNHEKGLFWQSLCMPIELIGRESKTMHYGPILQHTKYSLVHLLIILCMERNATYQLNLIVRHYAH